MTERTNEDLLKQENPWDVSNIQEFLYYNCPECDTRVKDSELFVQHALDNHELSKSYLNKARVEIVSHDQDEINSDHEMEEVKERKPTKEELILSEKTFNELKVRKIKVEPDVLLDVQDQGMDYQDDAGSDFDEYAEDDEDVKPHESYYCNECDQFFATEKGLRWHISRHKSLKRRCDMCDFKATNFLALRQHEKKNHYEEVQCETCDYKCHSKRMLENHVKTHSKVKCEQCDEEFAATERLAHHAKEKHFHSISCHKCEYKCHSKLMLESHWRTFHKLKYKYDVDNEGTFTCRVCHFKTQNEEEMKDHQWEHQDIKWRFKCELCEATFYHKYKCDEHKDVVHLGKLPHKCEQCDFSAKHRGELIKHVKKVHENIPTSHICPVCGKCVTMLKAHMEAMHAENDEGGTCDQCGLFFERKHLLKSHYHNYHTRKFQVCTICEKFFIGAKKQIMIDHYTAEHGIFCNKKNIYVCHICKTKVTSNKELADHYHAAHETKNDFHCTKCVHEEPTKALLTIHYIDMHDMNPFNESELVNEKTVQAVQVHEDDKAYQCTLCSKKLTSKVTLKNHIKQMHDKSNHVKCDLCPRTFNYPSELKKHVLFKHTAATRFPCGQCSYVTNRKIDLKNHIRKVHEKNYRHKCNICEKQFEAPSKLQHHMMQDHDILYKY